MEAVDFFEGLPSADIHAPVPRGISSRDVYGGSDCIDGPSNCSNCDVCIDDCIPPCGIGD